MTELVVAEQSQLMRAYGTEDEIGGIYNRLMKMHPSARDAQIGDHGMRMVAQRAILSGADPISEVHVWYNPKSQKVQTDLDISYYRRKAAELGLEILWVEQPRAITESERADQGIPGGTIAAYCRGALRAEVKQNMREFGLPFEKALQMCAREGVATAGDKAPPAGRTHTWVAQKRAEKDLYRKLGVTDNRLTTALTSHAHKVAEALTEAQTKRIADRTTVTEANDDLFPAESSVMTIDEESIVEGEIVKTVTEAPAEAVEDKIVVSERVIGKETKDPALLGIVLLTEGQSNRLHALGSAYYGKDWDAERKRLVEHVTTGAETSSSRLSTGEAAKLIRGLEKKMTARDEVLEMAQPVEQTDMSFAQHAAATEQSAYSD